MMKGWRGGSAGGSGAGGSGKDSRPTSAHSSLLSTAGRCFVASILSKQLGTGVPAWESPEAIRSLNQQLLAAYAGSQAKGVGGKGSPGRNKSRKLQFSSPHSPGGRKVLDEESSYSSDSFIQSETDSNKSVMEVEEVKKVETDITQAIQKWHTSDAGKASLNNRRPRSALPSRRPATALSQRPIEGDRAVYERPHTALALSPAVRPVRPGHGSSGEGEGRGQDRPLLGLSERQVVVDADSIGRLNIGTDERSATARIELNMDEKGSGSEGRTVFVRPQSASLARRPQSARPKNPSPPPSTSPPMEEVASPSSLMLVEARIGKSGQMQGGSTSKDGSKPMPPPSTSDATLFNRRTVGTPRGGRTAGKQARPSTTMDVGRRGGREGGRGAKVSPPRKYSPARTRIAMGSSGSSGGSGRPSMSSKGNGSSSGENGSKKVGASKRRIKSAQSRLGESKRDGFVASLRLRLMLAESSGAVSVLRQAIVMAEKVDELSVEVDAAKDVLRAWLKAR
uniref:Uncharacterized protein n=1 Tax=Palpitomonas bilix TaxID=652834 RepID=A0A7S3G1K3_9EUKA|mmetsp:Transcript_18372/g.46059  ORF Transcript_18372/g.46059 Transcript_18372/m.46059 type:complete len:509 (+) Transcript_18372:366-1892(+)